MTTQEQIERQKLDKVIDQMTFADSDLKKRIKSSTEQIVIASLLYSSLGKSFQFSANNTLNKKINSILKQLEEELYKVIYSRCEDVSQITDYRYNTEDEDDNTNLLPLYLSFKIKGKTLLQRINEYVSNMKYEIEAFIAIGIFKKQSKNAIVNTYFNNIKEPFKAIEIIQAYKETGFKSERIASKGISFGVGKSVSSFNNLKRLEQDTIFKSYNYINQALWSRNPLYIGWYTIRGSNYPCPNLCDPQVGIIHSKDEKFEGYHSRCCCLCIPVFIQI